MGRRLSIAAMRLGDRRPTAHWASDRTVRSGLHGNDQRTVKARTAMLTAATVSLTAEPSPRLGERTRLTPCGWCLLELFGLESRSRHPHRCTRTVTLTEILPTCSARVYPVIYRPITRRRGPQSSRAATRAEEVGTGAAILRVTATAAAREEATELCPFACGAVRGAEVAFVSGPVSSGSAMGRAAGGPRRSASRRRRP
jgi:hypothetical protein